MAYTPNFSGVIDALKTIIQTGVGGGGGGGGGDASAENQITEITKLTSIDTKLPSALVSDRIKTNTVGASLDLSGTATAINTDVIAATDISDYSCVIFQLSGSWTATVHAQFSTDNSAWTSSFFYNINTGLTVSSSLANGIFSLPKQGKYFRLRVISYSSGTIVATGQATNNAPAIIPIQTVVFNGNQPVTLSSSTVDTEFSSAVALNDSITPATSPVAIAANYAYNGSGWDRQRNAGTSSPGLGRSLVAPGTPVLNLLTSVAATGAGTSITLYSTYFNLTAQLVIVSGTLSTISCTIQGSMNGSSWFDLVTLTDTTNGAAVFVTGKCFLYIRANLTTLTGTSPIISVIAGATP